MKMKMRMRTPFKTACMLVAMMLAFLLPATIFAGQETEAEYAEDTAHAVDTAHTEDAAYPGGAAAGIDASASRMPQAKASKLRHIQN